MSQLNSNPFQDIQNLLQAKQGAALEAYIIKLTQQYNLYIITNFDIMYIETKKDQFNQVQLINIYAYTRNYIIQFIIDKNNKVSFRISPAMSCECGGGK